MAAVWPQECRGLSPMADHVDPPPAQQSRIPYRRLRAPVGDGKVLIDPPLEQLAARFEPNAKRMAGQQAPHGGGVIADLIHHGRAHLIEAAVKHTQQYAQTNWLDPAAVSGRIYMVGHQPTLFHPGVWLKSFVVDALAKRDGAAALHVLIDNDVLGDAAIQTPTGTKQAPKLEPVALDRECATVPWEERMLIDAEQFHSAGDRIAKAVAPFIQEPLALKLWQTEGEEFCDYEQLGSVLARMRHRLELQWGLQTLEVPLSTLCQNDAFRWLVAFVLSQLPRFQECHNEILAQYRRSHRLRSPSQPLPDLQQWDQLFETPFWVWTPTDPRRRKLLASYVGENIVLGDGEHLSHRVPRLRSDNNQQCIDALARLEEDQRIKIRPRALLTTMYLRLFLSDCFVHGIGGAKYDQITDCLVEEVLGLAPPAYVTVSGTRLLPIDLPTQNPQALRDLNRLLRDWEYHPENFGCSSLSEEDASRFAALAAEKRALTRQNDLDTRSRHAALSQINKSLRQYVRESREKLLRKREHYDSECRAAKVLGSREFSFCLFDEESLRPWLLDVGANAS